MCAPISEVMTRSVVCVTEHTSMAVLEELLLDHNLSGVPVVDNRGKLVGLVTMIDIVRELHYQAETAQVSLAGDLAWGFHVEPELLIVAHLMAPVAFELLASCPMAKAVSLMATQHAHQVPVVSDDGVLVGIVTAGDIVRHLARSGAPDAADLPDEASARDAERERKAETDRLVSLGFLAGGVAHQINNALTPMRLSLGRLASFELSRRPMSPERLHRIELLQDVREGVARIERIIRELKAFSHIDDSPSRAVDVAALLEIAIGLTGHEIRHRAQLVCDYAAVPLVRAKPAELRQVLLNLLVNAAQAIPEGEAHMNEIRATTRTDEHGRAVIEIQDTGTGISPDVAARIFEPFFTTRPEGKGLGLGLSVSRDIIAALDGEITVDSVLGKGTTIRVALPPCDEDVVAAGAPAEAPAPAATTERRRILILDDDRPVAAALALELEDHDVVVAESGREALEILRHDQDFDVILCDLMMPEVSGMDVYESLRLLSPTLQGRVVLMTGGAFTARARQFLATVDAMMIEKPFHPGQLHAVVHALEHRGERAQPPSPVPKG
jgi:signal transduction histidine kinase/CheY-like chemotaxis protein